jgi:hypothetical protein
MVMNSINEFRESLVYGDFRLFYNKDTYVISTGKLATRYLRKVLINPEVGPQWPSLGFSDLWMSSRSELFVAGNPLYRKQHELNFREFVNGKKKPETRVLILYRNPQEKTYSGLIQDFYISLKSDIEKNTSKKEHILTDVIQRQHIPLDPYQFIENLYPILQAGNDSINPKRTKVNILTGEEEHYKDVISAPHPLTTEEFRAYVGVVKNLLYEYIKNALMTGTIWYNHCAPWCIDAYGIYKYLSNIYPNTKLFDLDNTKCTFSNVLINEYKIQSPDWDDSQIKYHKESNKFGKQLLKDILFTELKQYLNNHLLFERLFYKKLKKLNNIKW